MLKQQVVEFLDLKLSQALEALDKLQVSTQQAGTSPTNDLVASMNTMINSLKSLKAQVEQGNLPAEQLALLQQQLYASFDGSLETQENNPLEEDA